MNEIMIDFLGDSGHVDDASVGGGGDGDDYYWYCNHSQWLIMKVITINDSTDIFHDDRINIDIDKSYCYV